MNQIETTQIAGGTLSTLRLPHGIEFAAQSDHHGQTVLAIDVFRDDFDFDSGCVLFKDNGEPDFIVHEGKSGKTRVN